MRRWIGSGARGRGDWRVRALPYAGGVVASLTAFSWMLAQTASSGPAERGRRQFQQSCGFCHGADATGARGPDLVRSKVVAHDVNGNLIGEVIRNGRPDKGMPALPLSADQIRDVAAFLHERAREALASNRVPAVYPLARLLTGKAEAGKAYFNGAGGCNACHSPGGDLAHVASKYPPLELEARMLYPRGAQPASVTVTLASGEQVSGRLLHLDEFMVSLREASGWYRSFPRDRVKVEVRDPLAAHEALLGRLTQDDLHNLFAYLETLR
jgi:cytochrome c oxidase cbb3-type subunit 3